MENINIKEHGQEKKKCVMYRCPECKVKAAYYRGKTDDYLCRTCRCVFEILKKVPE